MKKIRLDVEQLRVDSFATERQADAKGTVHGHATPISVCATCYSMGPTNCDCTYTCTHGFPVTCPFPY
jgi:hypothetical protein